MVAGDKESQKERGDDEAEGGRETHIAADSVVAL